MPSQITHNIFAEELLQSVFTAGEELALLRKKPGVTAFFAQGPDLFYHNQRTQPAAFKYGRILHRSGYGRVIRIGAEKLLESCGKGPYKGDCLLKLTALLSFASHAFLDRELHPFITVFSGWREPGNPETDRYYRMHPFFERILDLELLAGIEGYRKNPYQYDFYRLIDSPDFQSDVRVLTPFFVEIISRAYPDLNKPDLDWLRFRNAVQDACFFYEMTNPPDTENLRGAYERDRLHGFKRLILSLYYPRVLMKDRFDYGNAAHRTWPDPYHPEVQRSESFMDLYNSAAVKARENITSVYNTLLSGTGCAEIESLVGNGNLSNGEQDKNPAPAVSVPLPLRTVLSEQYKWVERTFSLENR